MQIAQEVWFLLFFVDFFLMGFVGVYAFYTYYKHRVDLKKMQFDTFEESKKILNETKERTQEVIVKVESKANELLNHSQLFKTDIDKNFQESLKYLEENYLKIADENAKKFELEYMNILTVVKDESIKRTSQAIEAEIKKQLEGSNHAIQDEIKKSLERAREEINQYKIKELAKIDEKIDQIVVDLAKDLLRVNLTPKDHKKLVIQALDKAKEQGLFFL